MKKIVLLFFMIAVVSSCVSIKERVYVQDDKSSVNTNYPLLNKEYKISTQDILYVKVKSLDNTSFESSATVQLGNPDLLFYLNGYSVNKNGSLVLPIIGEVFVLGKTLDEIKNLIQEKVALYYKDAVVEVQTAGVKISVLGEVNRPGKFTFYQNQVTIFDALASSGDLTSLANRKNVKLIRHHKNSVETHQFDLTNVDLLTSEYYILQPNDVIYIEPLRAKSWGFGVTGWQTLQTFLSTLSSTFLIINFFNN